MYSHWSWGGKDTIIETIYTGTDVIHLQDKSEGAKFTQPYKYDLHLIEWYMCQKSKVLISQIENDSRPSSSVTYYVYKIRNWPITDSEIDWLVELQTWL